MSRAQRYAIITRSVVRQTLGYSFAIVQGTYAFALRFALGPVKAESSLSHKIDNAFSITSPASSLGAVIKSGIKPTVLLGFMRSRVLISVLVKYRLLQGYLCCGKYAERTFRARTCALLLF